MFKYLFSFLIIIFPFLFQAQVVGISATNHIPDSSALLDVKSSNQGLLIPRMSTAQRDALNSPVAGLMIYNITSKALTIYTSNGWYELLSSEVSNFSGTMSFGKGVAINNAGQLPDSSAILDVSSTEKGLLMPRTETGLINNPATGLLIYNTSSNLLSYFDGTSWVTPCADFVSATIGVGVSQEVGVAINIDGSDPDPSAMLDLKASNLGFLIPRLSNPERNFIKPKEGLLIYNTTTNKINFWDNSGWEEVSTSGPPQPSNLTGSVSVCQGESGLTYSVSNQLGLTYNWTYSGIGLTIVSGQTTNSIEVDYSAVATSGVLSVNAANSCGDGIASEINITVTPYLGDAINTTDTAAICENDIKTLTATPTGGIWSIVSGGGSIAGNIYTPGIITSNTIVTINYTVPTNGTCPASSSQVIFAVGVDQNTVTNSTSNADICAGQTKTLVGTPLGGVWNIVNGGGSISGTTYTPENVSTTTSVILNYSLNNSPGCSKLVSNDVSFFVNPNPGSALNSTSSAAICENEIKTLVGTPSGGIWSIDNGGGTISGTTYTPANISSNTNVTIVYTMPASGGCAATSSSVDFLVNLYNIASNSTSTSSICESDSKILVGNPSGGTWSILNGGGTISGTTYTPPNITSNTNVTIRYSFDSNGGCLGSTSDITFTVNSENGTATNLTSTADICETGTKTLVGSPSGGTWNVLSGGGTISGMTYIPVNISSNTNVTVQYIVAGNGACSVSSSDVSFTVNSDLGPALNSTSTANICESETKALLGTPLGGIWSVISGSGTISGSTYTPTNISSNTSVTVAYTIASNGVCLGSTDEQTFIVVPSAETAVNTTSVASICEGTPKTLIGSPSGGTWSVLSGNGSISGNIYNSGNITSNSTVTIRYTIAGSGLCPASTSDRTFIVNSNPGVANNTTNPSAICEGAPKALTGSPSGGTWSLVSGAGSISGSTYNSGNISSNSTVVVRYTVSGNGTCPGSTSDQTFIVNSSPAIANNGVSGDMCETTGRLLVGGTPSGGTWSLVSGPGSVSGISYTSGDITSNATTTIRYTIPGNGACPASTDDATFTVFASSGSPAVNTTSTSNLAENGTRTLTGSPTGGSWSLVSGPGAIALPNIYNAGSVSSDQTVVIRYTISGNGACPATTDDVSFTIVNNTGGGGGGCFVPETSIRMSDNSLKPISTVKIGDMVLGYNIKTNNIEATAVTKVFKHIGDYEVMELTVDLRNGESKKIRLTPNHLLMNGELKIPAREFIVGGEISYYDSDSKSMKKGTVSGSTFLSEPYKVVHNINTGLGDFIVKDILADENKEIGGG